ncbi:MAG: VOC family protein [Proteobacteria bacterium]|nr:VOC family protein [Pseudomonadota bacterium]
MHPQKTMTLMIASSHKGERGEARLESLSPEAGTEDSPIAKFLAKKGAGIHHVALTVDHVATAIARLAELGVEMIDREPRTGAHQTRIAFVHPNSTGGILVELVEESGKNL